MKKAMLTVLFITLMFSCTTLLNPTEKGVGMFVLPVHFVNDTKKKPFGKYKLTIQNIDTGDKTSYWLYNKNGIKTIYLEPGRYETLYFELIYDNSNESSGKLFNTIKFNVNIADCTYSEKRLDIRLYERDGKSYMTRMLHKITDEDLIKAKLFLKEQDNSHLWNIN